MEQSGNGVGTRPARLIAVDDPDVGLACSCCGTHVGTGPAPQAASCAQSVNFVTFHGRAHGAATLEMVFSPPFERSLPRDVSNQVEAYCIARDEKDDARRK